MATAIVCGVFGLAALVLTAATPARCAMAEAHLIAWVLSTPTGWMLGDVAYMDALRRWALAGGHTSEWRILLPFALACALQWSAVALLQGLMQDVCDRGAGD